MQNDEQNKEQNNKVKQNVKDSLFRFLFGNDKENTLQLYNALNGTDYHDAGALRVVTLKNAVYVTMKNDLAFVLMGTLNMYEHQSTYSANMPVRFLIYIAEEYQKFVDKAESSMYGTKMVSLPTPRCVVFYNGTKEMPDESVLKLSDAFENKDKEADVELKVRMLNINKGHNEELMENCQTLKEYAALVDVSRRYMSETDDNNEALSRTINYCIEHGILSEFLRENRAEVLGMLLEEFDAEKYERTLRAEGKEEGIEEGIEKGRKEGIEKGRKEKEEEDISEFIGALEEFEIPADEIKQQLMKRFKLSAEAAEEKILQSLKTSVF
ncbi:MAG: hypothetical protein NC433_17775 [Clostridiales bacterium]|nr:hypothetical protein [Clostridiales bacterium]